MNIFEKKKQSLPEAVIGRCSSKNFFLKILQYLQENTCVRISLNIAKFLRKFFYRTPLGCFATTFIFANSILSLFNTLSDSLSTKN